MRKILTVLLLCYSVSSLALVPPRDPSRWEEWQLQYATQQSAVTDAPIAGPNRMPAATMAIGSPTIIPRILVIMVNFADYELLSTKADVDSMFNGQNWTKDGATGSVRQYFYDQSMGAYDPQFDIVGPVTLSGGYASYGSSNTAVGMVKEACTLVDDSVDFALYDTDNDGVVELVYAFYAGFGENDPPSEDLIPNSEVLVWPQFVSNISGGTYDGKRVTACEYSNELDGYYSTAEKSVIAGIGVACHEFGHALGIPDFYATNGTNHKLLGAWDLMCYGPYNNDMHSPPSLTAYERFYMGWLTPTLITKADTLSLEHIALSNEAFMITENDSHNLDGVNPDTTVFYLLENRQQQGWDIGIPGNGLMITRVDYQPALWRSNILNNNPSRLGYDLIEADGLTPATDTNAGYFGKPGDVFPEGATEYTDIPDHAITDISMTDGVITFVYRGGIQPTDTDSITTPVQVSAVTQSTPLKAYKTLSNGQLLIHSNGRTYSIYGIKQDD